MFKLFRKKRHKYLISYAFSSNESGSNGFGNLLSFKHKKPFTEEDYAESQEFASKHNGVKESDIAILSISYLGVVDESDFLKSKAKERPYK